MATTLSATIKAQINSTFTNTGDIATVTESISQSWDLTLAYGTSSNQANQTYQGRRTLDGGASESLDMAGVLEDSSGTTITFTSIRAIAIRNNGTNADEILSVGGAASNQLDSIFGDVSDILEIKPGGVLLLTAPMATAAYDITANTGDIVKVLNAGAESITYDLIIFGTVA